MQQAKTAGASLPVTQPIRHPVQQVCDRWLLRDANSHYGHKMAMM